MIKDIKDYLDRKKPYIYIYTIRKGLNIINLSNHGEKTNDIVVTERCKHNGMSWVNKGVTGIYSINLLRINGEEQWFDKHILSFKPMPHSNHSKQTIQQKCIIKTRYLLTNHDS